MKATIKLKTGFILSNYEYAVKEKGVIIRPYQDSEVFTNIDGSTKEYVVRRKADQKEFTKSKSLNIFNPNVTPQCNINLVSLTVISEAIQASGLQGGLNELGTNSGSITGTGFITPPQTPTDIQAKQEEIAQIQQHENEQQQDKQDPYPIEDVLIEE